MSKNKAVPDFMDVPALKKTPRLATGHDSKSATRLTKSVDSTRQEGHFPKFCPTPDYHAQQRNQRVTLPTPPFIYVWATSSVTIMFVLLFINGWAQGMGWPPSGRTMVHGWSQKERGGVVSLWNVPAGDGLPCANVVAQASRQSEPRNTRLISL
jgi:hypothetical protein